MECPELRVRGMSVVPVLVGAVSSYRPPVTRNQTRPYADLVQANNLSVLGTLCLILINKLSQLAHYIAPPSRYS